MTVSPCKDCTERHVSCHSHCGKYLTWRADVDKERELVYKAKSIEGAANKRRNDAIAKIRKQYAKKC